MMYTVIGLMSGTSLDGIDAAWLRTDGKTRVETGPFRTRPYDPAFRTRLRRCLGPAADPTHVAAVSRELTEQHATLVREVQALAPEPATLAGFHGHTVWHAPEQRQTRQIGEGDWLAQRCGVAVVSDFRSADVAAGGQGAPLVPLYHRALAVPLTRPLAVLNIGGVANLTWLGEDDQVLACDTGPGNALLDDWVLRHTGQPYDAAGTLAAAGQVDTAALAALLAHPYFRRPTPKSLDRDAFDPAPVAGLSVADGAATLMAFTVATVAASRALLPQPPRRWLVTGGGRHNLSLMRALAAALAVPVDPVEAVGWNGDALEAQAFAYLAVRSRLGLPLSLPETTGVPHPMCGGRFHP